MNTDIVYTTKEINVKAHSLTTGIKDMLLKIAKALSFDASAIFKSKNWPLF